MTRSLCTAHQRWTVPHGGVHLHVHDAAETRRLYRQRRYDAWRCRQRRDEHAVVREAEQALREGL